MFPIPFIVPFVMVKLVPPFKVPSTITVASRLFKIRSLSNVTVKPAGIIILSALVTKSPGTVPPHEKD